MKIKIKNLLMMSFVFGLFLFVGFAGFASAQPSEEMLVKVNVLETEVSISVPDEVVFEDITKGYLSERQDLDVVNHGTVDVDVSVDLDENYEGSIFGNLAFQKVLSDPLMKIRYFDFEIEKPSVVGGAKSQNIYMYLDLVLYEEEINASMMDHNATVIFTAVPL